jgi:uncharacterized protein YceH (UPF0502 family)
VQLGAEQGRIIGSLIEKQLTTPQQYPLTLNSLVLACNQSSNRDPVVSYDDALVGTTLATLKTDGLVRFVHPSHGRSVIRYRQVLDERLALDETELALLAVLLLRGPQTVGELRIRTERMASFDGIGGVESELARLAGRPDPLVQRLPRRTGQKEERWVELLTPEGARLDGLAGPTAAGEWPRSDTTPEVLSPQRANSPWSTEPRPVTTPGTATPGTATPATATPSAAPTAAPAAGAVGTGPTVETLSIEVAELRGEVARLRAAFDDLREQLGG